MTEPMELLDLTMRAVLAVLLGAGIGLERQLRVRSAGIKTNALVSGGAALFVIMGSVAFGGGSDPGRVAAQVVSGIGFLGAGVILRDGIHVRGLNTAATLWAAAAVGALSGAGMELMAVIAAAIVTLTHVAFRPVARFVNRRIHADEVRREHAREAGAISDFSLEMVTTDRDADLLRATFLQTIDRPQLTLRELTLHPTHDERLRLSALVTAPTGAGTSELLSAIAHRLGSDPKVVSPRWKPEEDEAED